MLYILVWTVLSIEATSFSDSLSVLICDIVGCLQIIQLRLTSLLVYPIFQSN